MILWRFLAAKISPPPHELISALEAVPLDDAPVEDVICLLCAVIRMMCSKGHGPDGDGSATTWSMTRSMTAFSDRLIALAVKEAVNATPTALSRLAAALSVCGTIGSAPLRAVLSVSVLVGLDHFNQEDFEMIVNAAARSVLCSGGDQPDAEIGRFSAAAVIEVRARLEGKEKRFFFQPGMS